tara:strand:+ start:46 stop:321 length:276 start_codon:yes stop_codon:yes gene_type:complete
MENGMDTRSATIKALDRIQERYGIDTDSGIADVLQTSRQAVFYWRKVGRVGSQRVLLVEEHSGVSRHQLRPDVYGPPPAGNLPKSSAFAAA